MAGRNPVERRGGELDGRKARPKVERRWLPWLTLAAVLLGIGSWRSQSARSTHPVRGWVLVGEEPAVGASVVFHSAGKPVPGGSRPTGVVQDDGSFELKTACVRPGAAAGAYVVTVEWREIVRAGGESVSGPSLVPDRYTRPSSSPLRATVEEGPNDLPPFWIERRYP